MMTMSTTDWLNLFLHFASLSMLAVGGAITTAPDMHRFLVNEHQWLTDAQFNSSIAIAQAAPGPNVLFVALMGWNVGINAGGMLFGMLGLVLSMLGVMIPSSTLTYLVSRWGHRNRERRIVRSFKLGMAPIVVALLVATGWILATGAVAALAPWRLWIVTGVAALIVWRTRIHLLWLLGAGALLGALGLV